LVFYWVDDLIAGVLPIDYALKSTLFDSIAGGQVMDAGTQADERRAHPQRGLWRLLSAFGALALVLGTSGPAWAKDCGDTAGPNDSRIACACGDNVVTDTELEDTDPVVTDLCTDFGLTLGADDIELDCEDETLTGDGIGAGIRVEALNGVKIEECEVTGFARGFVLANSEGLVVKDNKAHGNGFGFIISLDLSGHYEDNEASNNQFTGFDIFFSDSRFDDNEANGNEFVGFQIQKCLGCLFDDNEANGNEFVGFQIRSSEGLVVENSEANGNESLGFEIENCDDCLFEDNKATDNNFGFGLVGSFPSTEFLENESEDNQVAGFGLARLPKRRSRRTTCRTTE
jgi:parallel beta-helix repeat protein